MLVQVGAGYAQPFAMSARLEVVREDLGFAKVWQGGNFRASSHHANPLESNMIKDILVCLEGSPSSDSATRTAIAIAREQNATLVGMAVVDQPDICAGTPAGIGGSSF